MADPDPREHPLLMKGPLVRSVLALPASLWPSDADADLVERHGVSMAAWHEEVIGARAAAEEVVVLPAATDSERGRFFG